MWVKRLSGKYRRNNIGLQTNVTEGLSAMIQVSTKAALSMSGRKNKRFI